MNLDVSGIYKITNIVDGKIYIGSAKNIRIRWAVHESGLKLNKGENRYLQFAYNKHGSSAFLFEIILLVPKLEELIEYEQWYLDNEVEFGYDYNIQEIAGSSLGTKWTEEQKLNTKVSREVHQYDLSGIYLRSFGTITIAATELNVTPSVISDVCRNKRNMIQGYQFKYGDDVKKGDKIDSAILHRNQKPICQFDLNGVFLKSHESSKLASINVVGTDTASKSIGQACDGTIIKSHGFQWRYHPNGLIIDNTHIDNIDPYIHHFSGKNNSGNGKLVSQYDLNGNFVNEYVSVAEAARQVNVNVSGLRQAISIEGSSVGFQWRFSSETCKENIGPYVKYPGYRINKYGLDGTFIETFDNIVSAGGISGIARALDDNSKSAGGFMWTKFNGSTKNINKYVFTPSKPVYQLNEDGSILREFVSVRDACKAINRCEGSINFSIKKGRRCGGYKWKYKEEP